MIRRRQRPKEDDAFDHITSHVPKGISRRLKAESELRQIPVSKLICYALDNELDCNPSFNYETKLPDSPYREFEYAEEAGKILQFLTRHFQDVGTGLDTLLLFRRDIGIESKERFLLGFRELLNKKLIEEFYPRYAKFKYGKDYRYYRPSDELLAKSKVKKRKAAPKKLDIEKGPLYDFKEEGRNETD